MQIVRAKNEPDIEPYMTRLLSDLSGLVECVGGLSAKIAEIEPKLDYVYRVANPDNGRHALSHIAGKLYQARRSRDRVFGLDELFNEPAWDILLDLYIAHCKGRALSVTDACIGSQVPSTTALRWLTLLESKDLIERRHDPIDGRRHFIRLTHLGRQKVELTLTDIMTVLE